MDDIIQTTISPPRRKMVNEKLRHHDITFVRQFRWILSADHLPEHFMKKVDFDFVAKTISFEMYEVIDPTSNSIAIQDWLESDISNETMTFETFDGCGKSLYKYEIKGLKLVQDKIAFDYASSGEATRKVIVNYDSIDRTVTVLKKGSVSATNDTMCKVFQPPKMGYAWFMSIDEEEKSYEISLKQRPTLHVEESEINFLNMKTWIPGKAEWESLKVTLSKSAEHRLLPMLTDWQRGKHKICLHLHPKFKKVGDRIETWVLEDPWVIALRNVDDKYQVELRYSSVRYENEQARKSQD